MSLHLNYCEMSPCSHSGNANMLMCCKCNVHYFRLVNLHELQCVTGADGNVISCAVIWSSTRLEDKLRY